VAARLSFRRVLVVAQLASSVVLLLTAFLFLRNLLLSNSLSPGFDIRHSVWAYMRLVPERYSSRDPVESKNKIQAISRRALEQLRALPAVDSVATAAIVPLNGNVKFGEDVLVDRQTQPQALLYTGNWISPEYFKTMGISLLAGREFLPGRPGRRSAGRDFEPQHGAQALRRPESHGSHAAFSWRSARHHRWRGERQQILLAR
jgi:hypothetical protein